MWEIFQFGLDNTLCMGIVGVIIMVGEVRVDRDLQPTCDCRKRDNNFEAAVRILESSLGL